VPGAFGTYELLPTRPCPCNRRSCRESRTHFLTSRQMAVFRLSGTVRLVNATEQTIQTGIWPQSWADSSGRRRREKEKRRVTQRRRVAERHTYRRHPVPPRVPRGISRGSLALDGLGLCPCAKRTAVRHVASRWRRDPWGTHGQDAHATSLCVLCALCGFTPSPP